MKLPLSRKQNKSVIGLLGGADAAAAATDAADDAAENLSAMGGF